MLSRSGQRLAHAVVQLHQLREKVGIEVDALAAGRQRIRDATFDFAAVQARREYLAQRRLDAAELVGHAELHVQIAVVDGLQLDVEHAAFELP